MNDSNWLGWKRRVKAIMFEKGIVGYVEGTIPKPARGPDPVSAQREADIAKWEMQDRKAQTVIELSISDSQMIHLAGASTAKEMWDQLRIVKESRGKQAITTWQRKFYRTTADEGDDIPTHVKNMREIQETLHMMGSLVTEDDFCTVLISSLPESWDTFTTTYQIRMGDTKTITSHELISLILEENSQRKEKDGKGKGKENALVVKGRNLGKRKREDVKKCRICKKTGHVEVKKVAGVKAEERRVKARPNSLQRSAENSTTRAL